MELAQAHVSKAEHNLDVTLYLKKGNLTDWCSSTLFYTTYHCLLAILAKYGFDSRNQECTFAVIKSLIEDKVINISKVDLEKIKGLETEEKHTVPKTISFFLFFHFFPVAFSSYVTIPKNACRDKKITFK